MRLFYFLVSIVLMLSCGVPDKTPSSIIGTHTPKDTLVSPDWLDSLACEEISVFINFQNFDDLWSVNSKYISVDQLKMEIDSIHDQGKKVVAFWDATKTSLDCVWTFSNRDFYYKDSKGILLGRLQWADAAKMGLQHQMTSAMLHWIKEVGVDGFKCVNASKVPLWYWESLRRKLDNQKNEAVLLADSLHGSYYERSFDKIDTYE